MITLPAINLLPYREELASAARRQMLILCLGMAGIAIAVGLVGHGIFAAEVSVQNQRNDFLRAENTRLDKKIAEIKTLREGIDLAKAQQAVIQQLQSDRSSAVEILRAMVVKTPQGMYLKAMKQSGDKINVSGYALSNDIVSNFMTGLENSQYLEKPELVEIKAANVGNQRMSEFSINLLLKRAQREEPAEPAKNAAKHGRPLQRQHPPEKQS